MEQLLLKGESMEFFIEGSRSRTGKAYPPKGGLMSVIVDTLNKGKILHKLSLSIVECSLLISYQVNFHCLFVVCQAANQFHGQCTR